MLDAWTDLPAWLRITTALLTLIVGGFVVWFVSIKLGFALLGLGFGMVMVGGKSQTEKNGYHF